jgi:hypothetical protein
MRSPGPLTLAAIGLSCLIGAQCLASYVLAPMRADVVPTGDVYEALQPGEFAGTLLLGGFRGLASDLLWMRGLSAKDQGRFYESLALFETIVRIQPRFEQIWEYISWDIPYNIGREFEDEDSKWSWFLAGARFNVRGVQRNPQSERLLRHLAWLFHHKGDDYHRRIESASWAAFLNPVLEQVNAMLPSARRLALFPDQPGLSNFQISERLYRAEIELCEARHLSMPAYIRRMVPLALERDGNIYRNRGEHLEALRRYLESLRSWQEVAAWNETPITDDRDRMDKEFSRDSYDHNEARLRRKAAFFARQLAPDRAAGEQIAGKIMDRKWDEVAADLATPGWKPAIEHGQIKWLDEQ